MAALDGVLHQVSCGCDEDPQDADGEHEVEHDRGRDEERSGGRTPRGKDEGRPCDEHLVGSRQAHGRASGAPADKPVSCDMKDVRPAHPV